MAMIFMDARREGDTLVVRAYPEYYPDRVVEARAHVGVVEAKPEAVHAGVFVATMQYGPGLWIGPWHIRATAENVAEIYALLGTRPLAAVPECPLHRYGQMTMVEIATGVWRCEKCAPAEAPAASPDSPQQDESMAEAIGLDAVDAA